MTHHSKSHRLETAWLLLGGGHPVRVAAGRKVQIPRRLRCEGKARTFPPGIGLTSLFVGGTASRPGCFARLPPASSAAPGDEARRACGAVSRRTPDPAVSALAGRERRARTPAPAAPRPPSRARAGLCAGGGGGDDAASNSRAEA